MEFAGNVSTKLLVFKKQAKIIICREMTTTTTNYTHGHMDTHRYMHGYMYIICICTTI